MRLPPARATAIIVAFTTLVWVVLTATGTDRIADILGGFIPSRFDSGVAGLDVRTQSGVELWLVPRWLTPLTATLLHGGLIHIAFNMLMLGFCGRYVEAALGARGMIILYVIGAYAAAFGHYLAHSATTFPMIGASGAVSAVFGAYAMLYGERRQTVANRALNRAINVLWLAAAWIGLQLLIGFAMSRGGPGIAIAAHIGGFLVGLALVRPLLLLRYRSA